MRILVYSLKQYASVVQKHGYAWC